tara:strand:- start:442 stop:936 length:495 start_codon:yes stop_codon:yes gene_type:complete
MASELRVDKIHNEGGDNDSGIDLSTNDQIVLKTANTTRLTMNATGQTTIVGEGGTTTTSVQQGLAKCWGKVSGADTTVDDSFNLTSSTDTDTGAKTLSIANDMSNANYSTTAMVFFSSGAGNGMHPYIDATYSASQFRIDTLNYNNTSDGDCSAIMFLVAGDLA